MTILARGMEALPFLAQQSWGIEWSKIPSLSAAGLLVWGFVAVVVLAELIGLFAARHYLGRVWAIARHTILQAARMKVAAVLILFVLSLSLVLPFILRSDDTPYGRIRIAITYTLYAAEFLLCVLTLFLSTAVLCSEFQGKQIYGLDVKPVPRWCVLLGKWLGVMAVNVVLVACVGVIVWAIASYQARMPQYGKRVITDKTHPLERAVIERVRTGNEVLRSRIMTAREVHMPRMPDGRPFLAIVDMKAVEEFDRLKSMGALPKDRSEAWCLDTLRRRINNEIFVVPTEGAAMWRIAGLPKDLDPEAWITLRFQYHGSPRPEKNEIAGVWRVGRFDLDKKDFSGEYFLEAELTFACDRINDIPIKAGAIDPKTGVLTVHFINAPQPQNPKAAFPADSGMAVLVPVGGLGVNLFRGLLLVLAKLAYLAALGVFCAAFLGFAVASFSASTLFIVSLAAPFLLAEVIDKLFIVGSSMVRPGSPMEWADVATRVVLSSILTLFPDFAQYDPVPYLSDGLATPYGLIGHAMFSLVALRAAVLGLLGSYIFYRRELAALDR